MYNATNKMPLITKKYKFCAAHQYWNENWTQKKNEEEFGPDIYVHGHNYKLDVSITGKINLETGFIIDLKKIDIIVTERLEELTPEMVKDIIESMIKNHLGWLIVWGGVFGGIIGLVSSFVI